MRITPVAGLVVLAGAVAFGGGIVGLARVLPSNAPAPATTDYASGGASVPAGAIAPAPTSGATPAPAAAIGPPPASRPLAPQQVFAFDFRPLDLARRDRYGNPPKRAATPAELASIAAAHDVIVDDLRWQPDGAALDGSQIAAMKSVNPRLRVLRYLGALTNNDGPILNIAPGDGTHGSWFLRDGSGDFVRAYSEVAAWNGKPSYALDPSSTDVRNVIAVWARQFSMLGYDGVLLDGLTACAPAPGAACAAKALLSAPLDKTTNRPYTDAAWLAVTRGLLEAIRHTAPNAQIFLRADGDQSPLSGDIDGTAILSR